MLNTGVECPVNIFMRSQFDKLHKMIFLSKDPEAKYSQLGENIILET